METQAIKRPDNSKLIQKAIIGDGSISMIIDEMLRISNAASISITITGEHELISQMDVQSQKALDQLRFIYNQRVEQIKNYYEK